MAVMKLAGGKTVEVYRNRKCEHYLDFMQRCIYREKTEEPEEENNEKEEK